MALRGGVGRRRADHDPPVNSETDPRRQMLISMLMTGSTDSAIANTLNINVRSVRRWISELMDELGVSTRLQLGAALVRSDGLRGEQCAPRHGHLFDGCVTSLSWEHQSHARGPKGEPRASPRGEELRAEPRGKVPHGLCWLSHAHSQLNLRERQVSRLPCGRSGARFAQCKHYRTFDTISLALVVARDFASAARGWKRIAAAPISSAGLEPDRQKCHRFGGAIRRRRIRSPKYQRLCPLRLWPRSGCVP